MWDELFGGINSFFVFFTLQNVLIIAPENLNRLLAAWRWVDDDWNFLGASSY